VENENDCPACLSTGCGKVHRRTAWHYDIMSACTPDLFAFRCLQTSFSSQRVPGFWPGMNKSWRRHSGREHGFHVLRGIFFTRCCREGADFGDAFTTMRSPACVCDGQQPALSQRFNDGPLRPFRRLCRGARGIDVQMPKHLRLIELPYRFVSDDPAAYLPSPFADRFANAHGIAWANARRQENGATKRASRREKASAADACSERHRRPPSHLGKRARTLLAIRHRLRGTSELAWAGMLSLAAM
jgi:hypothetical protein